MKVKANLTTQTLDYIDSKPYIQGEDSRNKLIVYVDESVTLTNIQIAYQLQNGRNTIKLINDGIITITDTENADYLEGYNGFIFNAPLSVTNVAGNFVATVIFTISTNVYKINVLNTVLKAVDFENFENALEGEKADLIAFMNSTASSITIIEQDIRKVLATTSTMANDVVQDLTALAAYPTDDLPDGFRVLAMNDSDYDDNPTLYQYSWDTNTWQYKGNFDWTQYLDAKFDGYKETTNNYIDGRLDAQDETIAGLGQLRPSGVDTSTNILAKTSDTGIWIGSDTGYWYYWDAAQNKYVSGGVYQATEVADGSIGQIKLSNDLQDILLPYGIIKSITWISNKILYDTNVLADNSNFDTTDYIEIPYTRNVFVKSIRYTGDGTAILLYDKNKNFLRYYAYEPMVFNEIEVPIDEDVKYIRFSFCKVLGQSTSSAYAKYKGFAEDIVFKANEVDYLKANFINKNFIINKDFRFLYPSEYTLYDNYFYGFNSLSPIASDAWCYIKLEHVKAGEKYKIDAQNGSQARCYYLFDDNGNLYEASAETTLQQNLKYVTIPDTITDGILIINTVKTSGYFNVYKESDLTKGNILDHKILVCCGDSITYGADMDAQGILPDGTIMNYGWQISNRNNMEYVNNGVSGSTMQDLQWDSFSHPNGRYTQLPTFIDYLTIWFGWNDAAYGTLGTIDDDNASESFYGGYNVVLDYLTKKYPYTKIVLIVPFGATADLRQAVRNLCNKWGLACFDMYQAETPLYYGKEDNVGVLPSVVALNRTKYQANGAHPNYLGHKQLADMLEAFLRKC